MHVVRRGVFLATHTPAGVYVAQIHEAVAILRLVEVRVPPGAHARVNDQEPVDCEVEPCLPTRRFDEAVDGQKLQHLLQACDGVGPGIRILAPGSRF